MRRSLLALAAAIAAIGLFAGGLGWLLNPPRPPAGASRGERLYYAYCIDCHGADGRGSWRALLFLRRPGDLANPERVRAFTDEYLFTIVRQGGDVLGRPGMPAFRQLSDEDIEALIAFLRRLPERPGTAARLRLLLEPDEDDLVAALPHRHPHPIAGDERRGVEHPGLRDDGHRLHRRHAERRHRLVADEEEVRGGAGDDLAADLVGRRADDRAPEARRKRGQERGEERDRDDTPAAEAAGGRDGG